MKIRRIEIQGFKSFADRIVLKFGEGITGVVGPNGCGKSNIVDAIRWVMGEQSAKHLRGAGMQDVIFSGSESRGPSGFSEVTLTFRTTGVLLPREYADRDEVSVTRRLFRDGTSQYAINKVECRLRDIIDLFMGTGIGRNAYSIIEQGRIGLIVTAKPDDRRALIEDAAGVSRYKARRKQAERRIDASLQNLLRVTDITDELHQRLGSLQRQAKKAERYKRIKGELKDLDLHAATHRFLELNALEACERAKAHSLQEQITGDEDSIETDETHIMEALSALDVRKAELHEREERVHEHQQAAALAQNNIEFMTRERENLGQRREESKAELEELAEELVTLRGERDAVRAMEENLDGSAGKEAEDLQTLERDLDQQSDDIDTALKELETEKQSMVAALTAIAEHRNNLANLDRANQDLEEQIERSLNAHNNAGTRSERAQEELKQAEKALQNNQQLKLDLADRMTAQEELQERLRGEATDNEEQLHAHRQDLMDKRSRLNSLLEIQKNYEGCTDAVRSIMSQKPSACSESLHGLVADVVSAEPRYETAVEAVLGERLQYVIVNSQSDGVATIDYLKESDLGRSSFIPLDLREDHTSWAPRAASTPPKEQPWAEASAVGDTILPVPEAAESFIFDESDLWPNLETPGVCGKMVDLVRAQPGYEHVARVLLGDVVVVEGLNQARNLWQENGHRKTLVTLEGEVLDPVGVITGGSSEGVSAGMLAQKREINELTDAVRTSESKVTIAEERQVALKDRLIEVEEAIKNLAQEGHQEELSFVNLEQDKKRLMEEIERAKEEQTILSAEQVALKEKQAGIEEEAQLSKASVEDVEQERSASEKRVSEKADGVERLQQQARSTAADVTQFKVMVAANAEKLDSSKRNLGRIIQRIADVETRSERLAESVTHIDEETAALAEKIAGSEQELNDLERLLEEERQVVEETQSALSSEEQQLKAQDAKVRARRKGIDTFKEQLNDSQITIREFQLGRDALSDQIEERYRLELDEVLVDYHLLPQQSDEHQRKTEKLRKSLDNIGPINLTAIEEHAEVSERYEFLSTQKQDLEESIASLKAAIKRINKTSKERYLEAFRLVNEKFQQVFPKLFNGGRASLVMTDETDPLESGIEMLAQPPGKKLQSVNLLSGGEKALTATALIFSIFLIKPAPFCLLDEVDAPLDEANVTRYNEMLRDMSSISQFILITHNKRTMELPDRLYGVTMEEPGISKIVPVDVVDDDRKLRAV